MTDGAFTALRLSQVLVLLAVFDSSGLRTQDALRRLFLERSSSFEDTLAFLVGIEVAATDGVECALRAIAPNANRTAWVATRLFASRSAYRSEAYQYLAKYRVENGRVTYRSHAQRHSQESGVRNFLMDLGVITYDPTASQYSITPAYTSLFDAALRPEAGIAPAALVTSLDDRAELGLAAERTIVAFEKRRLGRNQRDVVDHVALRNAAAGYDIVSGTARDDGTVVPRYIEVKAVSGRSMQFHWTRNEIEVARTLGEYYYLYLLPVSRRAFDVVNLRMISDPCRAVLASPDLWTVESDVLRCTLNSRSAPVDDQAFPQND